MSITRWEIIDAQANLVADILSRILTCPAGMTLREMSDYLEADAVTVSTMLMILERHGLACRIPADDRVKETV